MTKCQKCQANEVVFPRATYCENCLAIPATHEDVRLWNNDKQEQEFPFLERVVEQQTRVIQQKKQELTTQKELNQKLQADNKDLLKDIQNYKQKQTTQAQTITNLEHQIKTQAETLKNTQQALTQQKSHWTQYIQQTTAQISQEITLLKGVLT